jgi:2-C-methyl-D-erythritol 4-phosphate cytidylyltransferase
VVVSASIAVILPAAGGGARMGGRPKAFLELLGEPLLVHALRPFLARADVRAIIVALPPRDAATPPAWLLDLDARITTVAGGAHRAESVRHALDVLPADIDVVVVHDAARPLVTPDVVARTLAAVDPRGGALAAIPAVDTLHEVDGAGHVVATPERAALWQAQTPQAFVRAILADACRRGAADGLAPTDEAALVVRYGGTVVAVEGARDNLKVTVPSDLVCAEAMLRARAS